MSFIKDQEGTLFFGGDFGDQASEGFGEEGDGERARLDLKREQDLLEEFEDRSGVGGDRDDPILRGVEGMGGIAQGGGFAGADLTGDDTDGAQFDGIEEALCEGLEARQGVEVLDLDVLREGVALKAEEVSIESHRLFSFRRVGLPDRFFRWEEEEGC